MRYPYEQHDFLANFDFIQLRFRLLQTNTTSNSTNDETNSTANTTAPVSDGNSNNTSGATPPPEEQSPSSWFIWVGVLFGFLILLSAIGLLYYISRS